MPAFPYDLTQLDNQFCTPGIPNLLIRGRFHSDKTRVNRKAPSLRVGKVRTGGGGEKKVERKMKSRRLEKKGQRLDKTTMSVGSIRFSSLVATVYSVQRTIDCGVSGVDQERARKIVRVEWLVG